MPKGLGSPHAGMSTSTDSQSWKAGPWTTFSGGHPRVADKKAAGPPPPRSSCLGAAAEGWV
eukprot:3427452-Pleurochrysis_carterae.AAC.2